MEKCATVGRGYVQNYGGRKMKRLELEIKVCEECPYFDDACVSGWFSWCLKSERDVVRDKFEIPDWCVLEDMWTNLN